MAKEEYTGTKEGTKEGTGSFYNMTKYHNYIKKELISDVAKNLGTENLSLLDISVGKGGDYWKWYDVGIMDVLGIDPSGSQIAEANKRYNSSKKKGKLKGSEYIFEELTITDPNSINILEPNSYDIVSCQFTLHYFFESEEKLETVIKAVSHVLKPGGFFIGTTIIGDKVKNSLNNDREFIKGGVTIKDIGNNSYEFNLPGVRYEFNQLEWYVDFNILERTCRAYGLVLRDRKSFKDMYTSWPGRKHFKFSDTEKEISFMYDRFIFEKE